MTHTAVTEEPEKQSDNPAGKSTSGIYQWYVVGVLMLFMLISWVDRQIIVLLIDPIRNDLGISEVQVSLLAGFAFAVLYAICGLPCGWATDRFSRRWIIFFGVVFWSIATFTCGLARNFGQLFWARVGVGMGEATLVPASYSILSDIFPPHRLALAISAVAIGAGLGIGISFAVGGFIASAVSHGEMATVPFIGEVRAWQVAFFIVGLPGPILALLMFTITEPKRTGSIKKQAAAPGSSSAAVASITLPRFLKQNWKFYVCEVLGFALLALGTYSVYTWGPVYLSRVFGWDLAKVGLTYGMAMAGSMIVGFLISGKLIDYLYGRGMTDAHMRVYSILALVVIPIVLAAVGFHNGWIFLIGFFLYKFIVGGCGPVGVTCLNIVTPNEFRGQVVAIYLFISTLGGQGLGPLVVAMCTQYLFKDDQMVGWSLALTLSVSYVLAAFFLWRGRKYMREMVQKMNAAA